MEENNKKGKIGIIITAIALVLVLLVSFTYAYFTSRSASDTQEVTTANIDLTFDDTTAIVNETNIIPLTEEEVFPTDGSETKASKKVFSITNNGTITSYVDIKLTNIVAENFKVYDLKWALLEGSTKITTGNFASIDSDEEEITLTTNVEMLVGEANKKTYTLLVWVHENEQDQSDLMNKTITFNIEIEANQNKSKTLASQILGENNAKVLDGTYNYETDFTCVDTEFTIDEETEIIPVCSANYTAGLYEQAEDSEKSNYGFSTYYYKGNVENNYVKFGTYKTDVTNRIQVDHVFGSTTATQVASSGDDILWRVVRINEDGSIKLIAQNNVNGSLHKWDENNNYKYIYDDGTNSTIKTTLESWYTNDITINESLVQNGDYCNDIDGLDPSNDVNNAHGNAWKRLIQDKTPIFTCPNDAIMTNEKMGLITADELVYGGIPASNYAVSDISYLDNYTTFWTMTPSGASDNISWAFLFGMDNILDSMGTNANRAVARPVITIKADTVITGGDGSASTPWIIG